MIVSQDCLARPHLIEFYLLCPVRRSIAARHTCQVIQCRRTKTGFQRWCHKLCVKSRTGRKVTRKLAQHCRAHEDVSCLEVAQRASVTASECDDSSHSGNGDSLLSSREGRAGLVNAKEVRDCSNSDEQRAAEASAHAERRERSLNASSSGAASKLSISRRRAKSEGTLKKVLEPERTAESQTGIERSDGTSAALSEGGLQPTILRDENPPTELIFKLERRGSGWGEEILPHITVEQRVIEGRGILKKRNRSKFPDPWREGSLELMLCDTCGIPEQKVDAIVFRAVAWGVTSGGRPLIDRRRRSRVIRNFAEVVEELTFKHGVPAGYGGVGQIIERAPELLLCKPSVMDRWDRRVVELAAFLWKHGHCNVEEAGGPQELAAWVQRVRAVHAEGGLSEERLQVLYALGFEFGDVAQITAEWEVRFDYLLEWVMWPGQDQQLDWVGLNWGAIGGVHARELALWVALQREFYRRGILPEEAAVRLEAIKLVWEPQGLGSEWMRRLGGILYVVERTKQINDALDQLQRTAGGGAPRHSARPADAAASWEEAAGHSEGEVGGQGGGRGLPTAYPHWWAALSTVGRPRVRRSKEDAVREAARRSAQLVAKRRRALASARLEPGMGLWLARQRRAWRLGRLSSEQAALLELAGFELDPYPGPAWREMAAAAAWFLQGSRLGPLPGAGDPLKGTPAGRREHGRGNGDGGWEGDGEQGSCPPARLLRRPPVRRWVETQRAVLAAGRLAPECACHMVLLGISWVLSDDVIDMSRAAWMGRYRELGVLVRQSGAAAPSPESPLADWLMHQRGLHALGWLPTDRAALLEELGVAWQLPRSQQQREWDARLGQLVRLREGHGGLAKVAEDAALSKWLTRQLQAWRLGRLASSRVAQLRALGLGSGHAQGSPVNF